jgi:hypothetical protein
MAGMKEVGEEVVRSYEERQRSLKGLKAATSKLLQGYRQAQQTVREELSEAKEAWQRTASALQKKRHPRSK